MRINGFGSWPRLGEPARFRSVRARRAFAALTVGVVALGFGLMTRAGSSDEAVGLGEIEGGEVVASWFAVGDTGTTGLLHRGQQHVADAIASLDEQAPSNGLVLLGDNFYPHGLAAEDREARLVASVVTPFCRFVELTSSWRTRVPKNCGRARSSGKPVSVWAVLGNHDHQLAKSANAQRSWIPTRIANWRMPTGQVETFALGNGVDLIAFDSLDALDRGAEDLLRALQASVGPWRILMSHHPLRNDWEPEDERARVRRLRDAIAGSGVTVHLALAGHEHNLQAIDLVEPGLGIQVIAGSGSRHRPLQGELADRLVGTADLGFARIDRIEGAGDRLRVTLFSVSSWPLPSAWPRPWASQPHAEATFDIDSEAGWTRQARGRSGQE